MGRLCGEVLKKKTSGGNKKSDGVQYFSGSSSHYAIVSAELQ